MSSEQAMRAKLFRAIHAEAAKRGMDHDAVRDVVRMQYGVHSMGDMGLDQLQALYRTWTGRAFRPKRKNPLTPKGYAKAVGSVEMVSGEDLELLARAFSLRGWGPEQRRNFIRRQLRGREQVRTRQDFHRVFSGVRAMNRRDGLRESA